MRLPIFLSALLTTTPALAEGIVPKDGMWTTRTESVFFADSCSGQIKPLLEPMANAMRSEETMEITFGGAFDPRAMDGANQEGVTWTQIDANTWQGAMANPATGQGVVASVRAEAIDPERIEGQMQMDIGQLFATDPEMAPMQEMAAGCAITVNWETTFNG